MRSRTSKSGLILCLILAMLSFSGPFISHNTAQAPAPILFSNADSTRAIAVDSINHTREPFAVTMPVAFGSDDAMRVTFLAGNLHLQEAETATAVTADAETESHESIILAVESVAAVPDQNWATAVTVKLPSQLNDLGDVLIRIRYHSAASNRVRVGIGHTGGGPPDDFGAVPTPAPFGVGPSSTTATAGTLTTDEVKTIIAQAVSAAVSLNRAVTVAVTDREGNVLGAFAMTGAPATMQIRGGGPSQTPDPITGLVPVGLEGTRL